SGQATDRVPDPDAIRADLRAYDPRMGPVNRDLAFTHHSHTRHVEALLELFARLAGTGSPVPGSLGEMAWLARQNWLLESRAYDLGLAVGRLHEELRAAHEEGLARERALAADRAAAHAQAAAWVERALEAERLAAPLHALVGTRRWRLATALARPLDRVRARR